MAKWTMDISKYAKKKGVEIKEVRKAYAFALYTSIVKKTPVDTGRARGNWNVSVGSADNSVDEKITKNQVPAKMKKNKAELEKAKGDESIFISNNLPYITTLEYGGYPSPVEKGTWVKGKGKKVGHYEVRSEGGFSKQALEGMVGVTLANNENIFNSAVRAVKGKSR